MMAGVGEYETNKYSLFHKLLFVAKDVVPR